MAQPIGLISVATDDLLHGGDEKHQKNMATLNERYKLGKFQYGEGRFTGKNFHPMPDGSIYIDQEHYVKEKVIPIILSKDRKSKRYSPCTEEEISKLRSLVGALAWLTKETRPDLCGKVSLLQQSFPCPRIKDIVQANLVAMEATKYPAGIRVAPVPLERLRVSTVTDASWGNAVCPSANEDNGADYWTEENETWTRHHVRPRRTVFHPGMASNGPDLHSLLPGRETQYQQENGNTNLHEDVWNKPNKIQFLCDGSWIGETKFQKNPGTLKADDIHEGFLQNMRLNTLSAECQSLVSGIGNLHWHRFLMLEAQNDYQRDQEWEAQMDKQPFLAVTDSKSLYDTLSKKTCPYSQIEDKRTAIDVSILKRELEGVGTVRWVDGRNMLADALTKNVGGKLSSIRDDNGTVDPE